MRRKARKLTVFTGSKPPADSIVKSLKRNSFDVIHFQTIKSKTVLPNEPIEIALRNLNDYQWLIFTSQNAVESFYELVEHFDRFPLNLSRLKIAVVGKKTAARLSEFSVKPNLIPSEYNAASLLKELLRHSVKGKKFLIPSSKIASTELKVGIQVNGGLVDQIAVYDTIASEVDVTVRNIEMLAASETGWLIFTSPSSFANFVDLTDIVKAGEIFDKYAIAAIGKTTSAAIEHAGYKVHLVPPVASVDSLVNAIIERELVAI